MRKRTVFLASSMLAGGILTLALFWLLGAGASFVSAAPNAELQVCPSGCAFSSIQEAVDAANSGDVIMVAQGTYTDVHARASITQVVYVSKTVAILGGYNDDFSVQNPVSYSTKLDALGQGRVLAIVGTGITPRVEGLRLTGGNATGLAGFGVGLDAGGGVYLKDARATISNCTIVSNTASRANGVGGGMLIDAGVVTLTNNAFLSNTATTDGGALDAYFSTLTLDDNIFLYNTAGSQGGGLHLRGSSAQLHGNRIMGNVARYGAGMYLRGGDATLINTVIGDNVADPGEGIGAGMLVYAASPRFIHTTIVGNSGGDGSGVHLLAGAHSRAAFTNTMIVSHTAGITVGIGNAAIMHATLWHANVTDYGGGGTIERTLDHHGDPSLAADGYHLITGSFAIDRGVDAGVTVDVDGDVRPQGAGFDIGADEFPAGKPDIAWEKTVCVNDDAFQDYGDGPFNVAPGDVVTVVDRVWVTATWPISFTLGEAWSPSLVWDSSQATTGSVSSSTYTATWSVSAIAPNAWHVLTKTWHVTTSAEYEDTLTETLTVEGLALQLPERILRFQHARPQPAWNKRVRINAGPFQPWDAGPFTVTSGDVMTVVDRIRITHTMDVSFTLAEDWGTGLGLLGWSSDAGTVTTGTGTLTWRGIDAAPNQWHTLTTTWRVASGAWLYGKLTETLTVEGLAPQFPRRTLTVINLGASTGCHARINDGTTTYPTVQSAVDAAQPGDLIKVAGTCTTVNTYGGLAQVVYLDQSLMVRGGYTTSNWTVPDPATHPTVLDARGQGRVMVITGTITPTIQGLHITGGDATGLGALLWGGDAGGGIYIVGATPVLSENVIYHNTASTLGDNLDNGGGVCALNSNARFYANTVYSNTASRFGGGMFLVYGAPILTGNIITGNVAAEYGGGLFLDSSNGTLTGNTMAGNKASQRGGGGLFLRQGRVTLIDNVVTGNIAPTGGGVYLELGIGVSDAVLRGNTIQANIATHGGGLYMRDGSPRLNGDLVSSNVAYRGGGLYVWNSSPVLTNTVVSNNQATGTSGRGAGLYLEGSEGPRLLHTTIVQNTGGDGSGVCVTDDGQGNYSSVMLTNTIIAEHRVGVTVTAGNEAWFNGTLWHGNTVTDVGGTGGFVRFNDHYGDPAFAPDGYHLTSVSAAIDRGVNAGVATDVDEQTRPQDSGYDVGADEFVCVGLTAVTIAGPTTGTVGTAYTFTATVAPPEASLVISYTWDPAPAPGSLLLPDGSVTAYAWDAASDYTITLTATNCGGSDTVTHTIHVEAREQSIYLPLVMRNW